MCWLLISTHLSSNSFRFIFVEERYFGIVPFLPLFRTWWITFIYLSSFLASYRDSISQFDQCLEPDYHFILPHMFIYI